MYNFQEIICPKCKKTFYLKSMRLIDAKTTSCYFCGYRIVKSKLNIEKKI